MTSGSPAGRACQNLELVIEAGFATSSVDGPSTETVTCSTLDSATSIRPPSVLSPSTRNVAGPCFCSYCATPGAANDSAQRHAMRIDRENGQLLDWVMFASVAV